MNEERIKERCKREDIALKIVKGFLEKDCYTDTELEYSLNTLLDLYNKQKEEIERLKNAEEYAKLGKETLLDTIHKQQKEIEQLTNGIRVLGTNPDIITEEIIKEFTEKPISEEYMKEFKSSYISKDKVLKALGYEENDEEYKRIYNKEELMLSLIRTINEECDRLEDIEDKKTMLEIHNIENMRDKYWEDKIRKRLEKLKEKEQELSDEQGYFGSSELQAKIEELEELLGE